MKRLLVLVALLAMPAAAQRIASDFEIAQMERQVATSRDFLSQVSGHLNLGDLRLTRNEPAAAHAEYLRAIEIAAAERTRSRRTSDLARYATATAYAGLGAAKTDRAAEAMMLFDEALRYASDDAKSWNLYANAMAIVHRTAKAIPAARNAVALAERDTRAGNTVANQLDLAVYRYTLASALIDNGANEEAQRLLATVVDSLRSRSFDALKTDVERHESFEIYSSARGDQAAYLSLLNRAQLRLAALYEARGDAGAARMQYENVVASRSDDATALAALARLTSGAERDRNYAAAFDANPFSPALVREYRKYLQSAQPEPGDPSTPGGAMRTALQQLARGEKRAARATLDELATKFPHNATIADLRREADAAPGVPAFLAATSAVVTPQASELRELIDLFANDRLAPEQRTALDRLTFTSSAVFDPGPRDSVFETGTIDGGPFRFSEPTEFAGAFPPAVTLRLTYRILGASGDALLL
ncbi:MAG: hypothetical protein ACXVIJ_08780, partial [Thermoanaerobaculia bacterium]